MAVDFKERSITVKTDNGIKAASKLKYGNITFIADNTADYVNKLFLHKYDVVDASDNMLKLKLKEKRVKEAAKKDAAAPAEEKSAADNIINTVKETMSEGINFETLNNPLPE